VAAANPTHDLVWADKDDDTRYTDAAVVYGTRSVLLRFPDEVDESWTLHIDGDEWLAFAEDVGLDTPYVAAFTTLTDAICVATAYDGLGNQLTLSFSSNPTDQTGDTEAIRVRTAGDAEDNGCVGGDIAANTIQFDVDGAIFVYVTTEIGTAWTPVFASGTFLYPIALPIPLFA
jgi:hypothetical protein